MTKHLLICFSFFFLLHPCFAHDAKSYTLDECFKLALVRSDSLASQIEIVRQAEERIVQARSSFFPSVSLNATALKQEASTNQLGSTLFPSFQGTTQVTGSMNIFKGLRDLAAVKQKGFEKESYESAKEQAIVQLFQDTAQAFYNVLAYEKQIQNYNNEIEAQQKRRDELLTIKKLGRAREVDIVSVDSSIADVGASIAGAQGLLGAARETLAFLTGLSPEISLSDTDNSPNTPDMLGSIETWILGIEAKPDVKQAKYDVDASKMSTKYYKGAHLPTLDFTTNYYLSRPDTYKNVNWDVQLALSFPLFAGGSIQSQVNEATSREREAEFNYEQKKREASKEIRALYKSVLADINQVLKLEQASTLADKKYSLFLHDNRAGNTTNVDTLQALVSAHQTKRSWDLAKITAKYSYAKLEAISGKRDLKGVGR